MQPEQNNHNGHEKSDESPSQPHTQRESTRESTSQGKPAPSARARHHTAGASEVAAAITQSLAQGICGLDLDGRIVYANPAAEELLGLTAAELLSHSVTDLLALSRPEGPRAAPLSSVLLAPGSTGETVLGEDAVFLRHDGTTFPASYVASPLYRQGTLRGIALAFMDISERKQREEVQRRVAEESATRASQLEATIEAMTDCVVIFDANGVILHANGADRALFTAPGSTADYPRTTRERAERMRVRTVDGEPVPPEQWLSARTLKGETFTSARSIDVLVATADGRDIALSTSGAPVYGADGEIAGGVIVLRDVTNRRRLEYAVTAHASQLEAIVDAMADGLLVFDLDGRILQVNAAARELLGLDPHLSYTLESVRERGHRLRLRDRDGRLLAEAEWPVFDILRGEVLSGETAVDLVARTPHRGDVQLSISGAPMRDSAGNITGAVLIIRDVTLRRQLEQAVVAHASRLEATIEAMADSVVVYDRNSHIVQVNAAARAFLALITTADIADVAPHERPALLKVATEQGQPLADTERAHRRILRGEVLTGASTLDIMLDTRDGDQLYVSISGAPIRDERDEIIGAVCIYRDVTARRELEGRTQDSLAALIAMAEALLRPMRENKDTARSLEGDFMHLVMRELAVLARRVLSCGRVTILTAASPVEPLRPMAVYSESEEEERLWWAQWEEGVSLSDVLGMSLAARVYAGEVVVVSHDETPAPEQPTAARATEYLVVPLGVGDEVFGVLETDYDGADHTYTASEIALTRAVAQLATMVIERERLLREREEARANELALREANRRMDDFLSIASHELKTPLTSLKLCVELAERRAHRAVATDESEPGTTTATNADAVVPSLMERQVARLERLVSDLLDASSIQADKLQLRLQPANLTAVVREVYLEQKLAHLDRAIALELTNETLPVLADPDRISQVVMNFLTNALKYSSPGYPVTVRVRREDEHALVEVRDQSAGIPPDSLPHLFDRFYRVPGVQVQSGSGVGLGLGLYICKTIIERHGGQVGVESTLGQGSTFWFSLPIVGATPGDVSLPAT